MDPIVLWWLVPSFFVVAVLYAAVGHGEASGYLALLALVPGPLAHDEMATTALTLNVLVAGLGWYAFARAGHFSWALTWPFLAASLPAAVLGGLSDVSARTYAALLAGCLLVAAARLLMQARWGNVERARRPRMTVALSSAGGVGWVSGVVGIGGGIFLSPLMLLMRWATVKQTAATSACFIVVNSLGGLAGRAARGGLDYGMFWPLLVAAGTGGVVGLRLGANHFSAGRLKQALAVMLVAAAIKLASVAWAPG